MGEFTFSFFRFVPDDHFFRSMNRSIKIAVMMISVFVWSSVGFWRQAVIVTFDYPTNTNCQSFGIKHNRSPCIIRSLSLSLLSTVALLIFLALLKRRRYKRRWTVFFNRCLTNTFLFFDSHYFLGDEADSSIELVKLVNEPSAPVYQLRSLANNPGNCNVW